MDNNPNSPTPPRLPEEPFNPAASEIEPPTQPNTIPTPPPGLVMLDPEPQPKPKKRGKIIGIIIAITLVLLGGGTALAYQFWYQNPEKVVTDSIINAFKAKTITYTGSLTLTGEQKVKVTIDGANNNEAPANKLNAKISFTLNEKEYTLSGNTVFDAKGDLYLKFANIATLIVDYRDALPPESQVLLDKLVAKIDNQWVKVSSADLALFNEGVANSQKCAGEVAKKIQSDQALVTEVSQTYKNNRFVTIKKELGMKDGNLGYELGLDTAKAKTFYTDVKNTKIYKLMKECNKNFELNEGDIKIDENNKDNSKTELWVSMFAHEITKFSSAGKTADGKSSGVLTVEPQFNKPATIATPEDSVTLKQLQQDILELLQTSNANQAAMQSTEI